MSSTTWESLVEEFPVSGNLHKLEDEIRPACDSLSDLADEYCRIKIPSAEQPNVSDETAEMSDHETWNCAEIMDEGDGDFPPNEVPPPARRPTFIDKSQAEWNEHRVRLGPLYKQGMAAMEKSPLWWDRFEEYNTCPHCGSPEQEVLPIDVFVIQSGVIKAPQLYCPKCFYRSDAIDLIGVGFWPVTLSKNVYITFEMMELLSLMTNFNPLLSGVTMTSAINFASRAHKTGYSIRREELNGCLREWKRLETSHLASLLGSSLLDCPACGTQPHCLHIDGNCKLYRYKNSGRATSAGSGGEDTGWLLPTDAVHSEVERLRSQRPGVRHSEREQTACEGRPSKSVAFTGKKQTGVMLASCRHMLTLRALDMQRGEIFEYPYILQRELPMAKFIAYDMACRYWPWLEKVDADLAQQQRPLLSVLHAKSHIWTCQVKWSGKVLEGAGRSTGETSELVNSYLSRLGPVTRHMTDAGRRERLTQSASFWNLRKILELPSWIKSSMTRTKTTLETTNVALDEQNQEREEIRQICLAVSTIGTAASTNTEVQIEELACSIHRLEGNIANIADSAKTRAKLRSRLSTQHEKYNAAAKKYITNENTSVTEDAMKKALQTMIFPWVRGPNADCMRPDALKAVELLHQADRCEEELRILKQERDSLLTFVAGKLVGEKTWVTEHLVQKCREHFPEETESWGCVVECTVLSKDDDYESEEDVDDDSDQEDPEDSA